MTQTTVSAPVADANQILDAIEAWIKQRPGLDPADYGCHARQLAYSSRNQQRDAMRALRAEIREIGKDRQRAMKVLAEARRLDPHQPDLMIDAFHAFSGRLEWKPILGMDADGPVDCPNCGTKQAAGSASICASCSCDYANRPVGGRLEYTTGQYWPTEYRKAAASVLESYISAWHRRWAEEHPKEYAYRTIDDVRAANEEIGNHWFERGTMRFFKTRIESDLRGGKYFVTSEQGPDNVRKFSVRRADPDGTIDTVGEFQAHRTRGAALGEIASLLNA